MTRRPSRTWGLCRLALAVLLLAAALFGRPTAWGANIGHLVYNHIFIGDSGNQAIDAAVGGDCTMALVAGVATVSCTIGGGLANSAANTYLGNPTSGMAAPVAIAVAACSAAHDAEQYTSNTGLTCATDLADLDQENSFTKHQEPVPVALTDGSSITVAGTDANLYTLTLTGNSHTLACPSTIRKGSYNFRISQDSTGSRTGFATDSCYKYPGGAAPSWSTAANAVDVLSCSAFDTSRLECNALINLQ